MTAPAWHLACPRCGDTYHPLHASDRVSHRCRKANGREVEYVRIDPEEAT